MLYSWRPIAVLICAALFLQGCATSSPLSNARTQFYSGQHEAALATLDDERVRSRDKLLAHLDTGLIAHTAGLYEDSIKAFLSASALLEELDVISLSEQGASLVTNEWATSYKGEYSERLLIHSYQMMNFLLLRQFEGAAVEARLALKLLEEFDNPLSQDWFSRALVAMSFEAAGNPDSAHIEYKKLFDDMGYDGGIARAAWINARRLGREQDATHFAASLRSGTSNSSELGELVLFLQAGSIARKLPGDLFLSTDLYASFPLYPEFPKADLQVNVSSNGAVVDRVDNVKTQTVNVARASLAERGNRIAAKQVARLAAKKNLAQAARRENEGLGAIVSVAFLLLEQADTRSWETLPAHLNLVQIPLTEGTHQIALQIREEGRVHEILLDDINIKANQRVFRSLRVGAGGPPLRHVSNLPSP